MIVRPRKRAAMATRFASLRDDDVDAGALERNRFVNGGRGAGKREAARLDLLSRVDRQHAEREAEDRRAAREGRIELRVEIARRGRRRFGPRQAELFEKRRDARDRRRRVDRSRQRRLGNEQVDAERTRRFRPHGCADFENLPRRQIRRTDRSERARFAHCRHERGRISSTGHRRLNDWMLQTERLGQDGRDRHVVRASCTSRSSATRTIRLKSASRARVSRTAIAAASSTG